MSKIQEKKNTKIEEVKKEKTQEGNDWSGFATSFLKDFINIVILLIVGSNLLFIINDPNYKSFFPTNKNEKPYNVFGETSIFKTFPYQMNKNPENIFDNMQNWFARTNIDSWSSIRNITKEFIAYINNIINFNITSKIGLNTPLNIENKYKNIMESITILFSPVIIVFTAFILTTINFFMTIISGVKNSDGVKKFVGLFAGYNLAIFLSIIQWIWMIFLLMFKGFTNGFEHIYKQVKSKGSFLKWLVIIALIYETTQYLETPYTIGVILGIIFLHGGYIVSQFI